MSCRSCVVGSQGRWLDWKNIGVGGENSVVSNSVCDEAYVAVVASSKGAWYGSCVCFDLFVHGLKVRVFWISCHCGEGGMVEVYLFEVDGIGCSKH